MLGLWAGGMCSARMQSSGRLTAWRSSSCDAPVAIGGRIRMSYGVQPADKAAALGP